MFDWSIGADVDTAILRTAAEQGWSDLQELYGKTTVLEGDVFWQVRNEAEWLRRAMTHLCGTKGAAKRWQRQLTPKALTFCAGTPLDGLPPRAGCGCVIDETEHESGGGRSYWRAWCDEHRPRQLTRTRR